MRRLPANGKFAIRYEESMRDTGVRGLGILCSGMS